MVILTVATPRSFLNLPAARVLPLRLTKKTRSPSCKKSTSVSGVMPNFSRMLIGIVTCPQDGETIATDPFKIKGQNSLKNNFKEKKISRHLAYIDEKIIAYEALLDSSNKGEDLREIDERIVQRKQKRVKQEVLRETLETSGEKQIFGL